MELLQNILAYLILALAVGYLLWKFILPKSLVRSKNVASKSCGQDDCRCH